MKLLIITQTVDTTDPILGFFHRWIEEFAKNCEKVTVIALGVGTYNLPSNVQVLSLGKEQGKGRLAYIKNFYSYIVSRRNEYDAVFVHMNPVYMILGFLVWKIYGKRTALWYVHKRVDLKLRLAAVLVDRIFTASKESFRLASKKVIVTGHGILTSDVALAYKDESETKVVATLGRISEVKNLDFLITSFAKAQSGYSRPVRFEIVGEAVTEADKEYRDSLYTLIQKLNVADSVIFKGVIANNRITEYMRTVDVTVNASSTGSLDKAVLESMVAGVPPLTANEAFKDMLSPFGLYSELGDTDKFAFRLASLLKGIPLDRVALRGVVEKNHSLVHLIARISQTI